MLWAGANVSSGGCRLPASLRRINQVGVLEYPWCSGGIGSWGCGPSFGVGSVNVGLVSHLGTNLDFAFGAILKGLVAWGGGNSGGAPLGGVLWLGGWLVVAFSVPGASPRHLVFDFLVEACFPFLFVTHLY